MPLLPEVPLVPEEPDVPLVPEEPDVPVCPDVPLVPEDPDVPDVPLLPEVPLVPEDPDVPLVPDEPEVPEDPLQIPTQVILVSPEINVGVAVAHIVSTKLTVPIGREPLLGHSNSTIQPVTGSGP